MGAFLYVSRVLGLGFTCTLTADAYIAIGAGR